MTQDEIIEMAKQSNLLGVIDSFHYTNRQTWIEEATAFAKLVAEKEREACAKLVEDSWMAFSRVPNYRLDITPFPELSYVAKVIRARGN